MKRVVKPSRKSLPLLYLRLGGGFSPLTTRIRRAFSVGVFSLALASIITATPAYSADWELRHEDDNVRVYRRDVADTNIDAIKIESHFDADMAAVADLLSNPARRQSWDELCKVARWVVPPAQQGPQQDLLGTLYLYYDMPWPVKDRDMVMQTRIQRSAEQIVIRGDAVTLDAEAPKTVSTGDAKRLKNAWYEWRIQATESGGSQVTATMFMDPDGPIPAWLLNHLSVTQPSKNIETMKALLDASKKAPDQ
ncbi:START domain-containing protein [Spongiibacter taiwanensis]|uniref:START domain-containing protein n=1 Tax=Spongiibacter taiwanensis TaxID=1748242 RepID=UPI002035698E|nr:START domain-containing protein [Spongiibacter taiwanensis]USA42198.1 START domain-containing protein [Spongiibacter taiwanensis]